MKRHQKTFTHGWLINCVKGCQNVYILVKESALFYSLQLGSGKSIFPCWNIGLQDIFIRHQKMLGVIPKLSKTGPNWAKDRNILYFIIVLCNVDFEARPWGYIKKQSQRRLTLITFVKVDETSQFQPVPPLTAYIFWSVELFSDVGHWVKLKLQLALELFSQHFWSIYCFLVKVSFNYIQNFSIVLIICLITVLFTISPWATFQPVNAQIMLGNVISCFCHLLLFIFFVCSFCTTWHETNKNL